MMKDKFPIFRKQVYEYINKEIIPNNDNLEYCISHTLPEGFDKDVEYIFKVKSTFPDEHLNDLQADIEKKLLEYCRNEESVWRYYFSAIMSILSKY